MTAEIVTLQETATSLRARDWTPSVELAASLVSAAVAQLQRDPSVANSMAVRDTLLTFEDLFSRRGAQLIESNTLVAQRIRTEHAIGRYLQESKQSGDRTRLAQLNLSKNESSEFQRIADLDLDDLEDQIQSVINTQEISTAWALRLWQQFIGQLRTQSSASNEWYTPPPYIEAARMVLGGIDVDPASNEEAQKTVRAKKYYDQETDGLCHDWPGRVWLNPPYGGLSADFTQRLLEQYEAGITTAAVLLVNANSTETAWFAPLWDHRLCFVRGRINFMAPFGTQVENSSTHGSVIVYLGPDTKAFYDAFHPFGPIVRKVDPRDDPQS